MSATVKRVSDRDKDKGFWENLLALPLVEKILCPLALVVIVGWLIPGSGFKDLFFHDWFAPASFLAALAIATLIILKLFGKRFFPEQVERYAIALVSLLPVIGFLLSSLRSVPYFLTVGGSLALAYVSASVYWRQHIPDLGEKLGEQEKAEAPDEEEEPEEEPAEAEEPEKSEPPAPTGEGQ